MLTILNYSVAMTAEQVMESYNSSKAVAAVNGTSSTTITEKSYYYKVVIPAKATASATVPYQ